MSKKLLIAIMVAACLVVAASSWYVASKLFKPDGSKAAAQVASGEVSGQDSTELNTDSGPQNLSGPKAGNGKAPGKLSTEPEPDPTKEAAPAKVIATGKKLPEVVNPPEKTLAMVDLKDVPEKGYQAKLTFRLYGTAMGGQAFVLAVSRASTDSKDAAFKKVVNRLAGSNLLVDSSPESSKAIAQGGEYTGTITTVNQGGTTYGFRLESAAKASK